MKLNKEVHFNAKKAKETFIEEYKFINEVFSRSALPVHNILNGDDDDDDDVDDDIVNKSNKHVKLNGTNKSRNYQEIQEKLEKLRGTKGLDYKEKLKIKNLKRQLKKKTKQKDRKLKDIIKIEKGIQEEKIKTDEEQVIQKAPKTKPIFNAKGHMVFSKFDFKELGDKKHDKKNKKNGEKDPKKILERLKEKKQKIKSLEQMGEKEKAVEIREKDVWQAALARANGERVKDDPELLKKKIKRDEKKKARSAKNWQARKEAVQNDMQKRQEKRLENINSRKKEKKMNKLKKAAKKGRIIPGF